MELRNDNLNICHKHQSKIIGLSHCTNVQTSKFL